MTGLKFLLVFGLLNGLIFEKCDLGELDIEEFADKVTVTNVSTGWPATVLVEFDHSRVGWRVPGGQSRTASGLLATTWSVNVIAPASSRWQSYRERLQQARDELVALTLDPLSEGDQVTDAAAGLLTVVGALEQLGDSDFVQSCAGKIEPGVEVHVTIDSTKASDGTRLWVLDCG